MHTAGLSGQLVLENSELPGGPVVRTWCSPCDGPRFDPWLGNKDPASCSVWPKRKFVTDQHPLRTCLQLLGKPQLLLSALTWFPSACVAQPLPLCCKNTHLSTDPRSPQGQSLLSIKCVSVDIQGPVYCLAHSRLSVNICCWILLFPILFSHLFRESKNAVVLVCSICHCWPSALLSVFSHWVFYLPVFAGHSANWPTPVLIRASLVAQIVKNLPVMWETWVQSLGWEDLLEEGMATHSSILAWNIQRSLMGYSPWGRKDSDTSEWLRTDKGFFCGQKFGAAGVPECVYLCKSKKVFSIVLPCDLMER